MQIDNDELQPVRWVGSSNADLRRFPDPVRRRIGFAIHQAQVGLRHRDAKPLKGFGPGVLEIAVRLDANAYRAVYAVRSTVRSTSPTPSRRSRGGARGHRSPTSISSPVG